MVPEEFKDLNIQIKQMKPASKIFLCPDIRKGVCYFAAKF